MWIKTHEGTLVNAETIVRIEIIKFYVSETEKYQPLVQGRTVDGDSSTLAIYETEEQAAQAIEKIYDNLGANNRTMEMPPVWSESMSRAQRRRCF